MFTPESIFVKDERFVPFISQEQIDARISLMGKQLDKDYKDLNPIFIGVLNGSFIFLADLMRTKKSLLVMSLPSKKWMLDSKGDTLFW